jgi:hypothetical protein
MSEFAREALPIAVMYGFVLLLAPFIGYAMWIAFEGDRLREDAVAPAATEEPAGQDARVRKSPVGAPLHADSAA